MDKQLAQYIRHHIVFIAVLVIVGFSLLAAGEYYLYRQTMYLNKMISEGFMQLKSAQEIDRLDQSEKTDNDVLKENYEDNMMDDQNTEMMK